MKLSDPCHACCSHPKGQYAKVIVNGKGFNTIKSRAHWETTAEIVLTSEDLVI